MNGIELPADWKIRYADGYYQLLHRTDGDWRVMAGPYRQRIAAVRKWQRQQFWSAWALPEPLSLDAAQPAGGEGTR
jgi:hypothetical protein